MIAELLDSFALESCLPNCIENLRHSYLKSSHFAIAEPELTLNFSTIFLIPKQYGEFCNKDVFSFQYPGRLLKLLCVSDISRSIQA